LAKQKRKISICQFCHWFDKNWQMSCLQNDQKNFIQAEKRCVDEPGRLGLQFATEPTWRSQKNPSKALIRPGGVFFSLLSG
jgi:hypothetical protein